MKSQDNSKQPEPIGTWVCDCGTTNTNNFCSECGSPKPAARSIQQVVTV